MIKHLILFFPLLLAASPEGGVPVSGSVEIAQTGNLSTISASDKAIIEWRHFGIESGESVLFIQPSATASVLNRVAGESLSEINGLLQANGQVFLINPNGILIGPEGRIETAAFLGSTLDLLSNPIDFDASLEFKGAGTVSNFGRIHGKEWVCLIGSHILNEGTIEGGDVALASAPSVFVRPRSQEGIWIQLQENGEASPFAHAINLNGTVKALRMAEENGRIVLKADQIAIEGALEAPSGSVSILGKQIDLNSGSQIFVSGTDQSNSGEAIIQAASHLTFSGRIEAKGGPSGGNGGFVELSGKSMHFQGIVDRTAPQGIAGTLLIDPSDIHITNATSGNVMFAANTYSVNGALPTPATIDAAAINANLALGPVAVTTSSGFSDAGNILITSALSWNTAFPLTLFADGSITLQNTIIQNMSNAPLSLTALNSITLDGGLISSMNGDISLSAASGNVNLIGTAAGSATIGSFGGNITVSAGTDVSLLNSGNPMTTEVFIGVLPGGGSTAISAGRDILLNNQAQATTPNPVGLGGSNNLNLTAGRDIILQNPNAFMVALSGDLSVVANRNVSLDFNCAIFLVNQTGTLTIVTDNQAPASPQVGDGGLQMHPQSVIGFIPGPNPPPVNIRVYTARPSQNNITILNWAPFIHDPAQIDSATEVYGVYFPSAIPITSPLGYIVFYKTVDIPPSVITQQVPQVLSAGFETLRRFSYRRPYSLLNDVERFWTLYKEGDPLLNRTIYPIFMNNYREFTP